jgi:hypothetical protein
MSDNGSGQGCLGFNRHSLDQLELVDLQSKLGYKSSSAQWSSWYGDAGSDYNQVQLFWKLRPDQETVGASHVFLPPLCDLWLVRSTASRLAAGQQKESASYHGSSIPDELRPGLCIRLESDESRQPLDPTRQAAKHLTLAYLCCG